MGSTFLFMLVLWVLKNQMCWNLNAFSVFLIKRHNFNYLQNNKTSLSFKLFSANRLRSWGALCLQERVTWSFRFWRISTLPKLSGSTLRACIQMFLLCHPMNLSSLVLGFIIFIFRTSAQFISGLFFTYQSQS